PAPPRALHSFPTRRSSDLHGRRARRPARGVLLRTAAGRVVGSRGRRFAEVRAFFFKQCGEPFDLGFSPVCSLDQFPVRQEFLARSEEHTSELQYITISYAV